MRMEAGTMIVFTGPVNEDRQTTAEMAGFTLGLQQVECYTTRVRLPGDADAPHTITVTPAEFVQSLQKNEFIDVFQTCGDLTGVKYRDIERLAAETRAFYAVMGHDGSRKLKELYGDRVIRIFIYKETGGLSAADAAAMKQCEYVFNGAAIAYMMYDLTKVLDPLLQRNLIEYD